MQQKRRTFLQQGLLAAVFPPFGISSRNARDEVIHEQNCLSKESAEGFRSVVPHLPPETPNLIILAGAAAVGPQHALSLRTAASAGSWLVWECSPFVLREGRFEHQQRALAQLFGISIAEPIAARHELYIQYRFPRPALTRAFVAVTPVRSRTNILARYGDVPVAVKANIGRGGILFLGSMLGPHLHSGDRQAIDIATDVLASLGPSTAPFAADAELFRRTRSAVSS